MKFLINWIWIWIFYFRRNFKTCICDISTCDIWIFHKLSQFFFPFEFLPTVFDYMRKCHKKYLKFRRFSFQYIIHIFFTYRKYTIFRIFLRLFQIFNVIHILAAAHINFPISRHKIRSWHINRLEADFEKLVKFVWCSRFSITDKNCMFDINIISLFSGKYNNNVLH